MGFRVLYIFTCMGTAVFIMWYLHVVILCIIDRLRSCANQYEPEETINMDSLQWRVDKYCKHMQKICKDMQKLDPVGSTVRYEMMKLCTWSVEDPMRPEAVAVGN